MTESLNVESPKRNSLDSMGRASLYPYYAGFSVRFARSLLASADLDGRSRILDPWNGAGTTTSAAASLELIAKGYDLNPVMAVIAKARMLSNPPEAGLTRMISDIVSGILHGGNGDFDCHEPQQDPLSTWFRAEDVSVIREVERCIRSHVAGASSQDRFERPRNVDKMSELEAFFYVALFRTVRIFLTPFLTSNPTWIKRPGPQREKTLLDGHSFLNRLEQEVLRMVSTMGEDPFASSSPAGCASVSVASSLRIPEEDNSADFVLSSPPYCTRIDYAVATMPELALLGYSLDTDLRKLRRMMIGTSTVPLSVSAPLTAWGKTCNDFLDAIWSHGSKASRSYYYKNHVQYFHAIYVSLKEIHRVLLADGRGVLVVQDSCYKEVHNDLPQVFVEMGHSVGLHLTQRHDFSLNRTFARINPTRRLHRDWSPTESVLCFIKERESV